MKDLQTYLEQINERQNKIGIFVDILKETHDLPDYDLDRIGGRVAGMIKLCKYDYNFLMHTIWDTRHTDLVGSRVDYITRILAQKLQKKNYTKNKSVVTSSAQVQQKYRIEGEYVIDTITGARRHRDNFNKGLLDMIENE